MRLSTIVPGYLLGVLPFPGPKQIYLPGMSMNWIQTYVFLSNIMISANRFVATEFILSK